MQCLQLRTITQRVNTRSGRTYAEDPTVFAWELCNECQCVAAKLRACRQALQTFIVWKMTRAVHTLEWPSQ